MATNFPTSTDTLSNPASTDKMDAVSHSTQHINANDAIEALQEKVGVNSSAVTSSLDYKVNSASSEDPGHTHTLSSGASDVTATAAEVNKLDGVTSTTAELNILDGVTSTTAELNYLDGLTEADIARRVYTKIVSTDSSGDYECDGTDDDVQIQAAIDAVGTAGGGTVLIRAGTYVIGSEITFDDQDNIRLIGEGIDATVLQAKAGFADDDYVIHANGSSSSLTFQHFTIDGNKSNNTGTNGGLKVDGNFCSINSIKAENLSFDDGAGVGIWLAGGNGNMSNCVAKECEDVGIVVGGILSSGINCQSYDNAGHGFQVLSYAKVESCTSTYNEGYGIYLSESNSSATNCYVYDSTDNGIHIDSNGHVVSGCMIFAKKNGIYVDGDYSSILNNIIDADTADADNTYSGIMLYDANDYNIVSGNTILSSGSNNFQYGIREGSATTDHNVITSNIVTDGQTAKISTQGANTDVSHNITS